MSERSSIFNLRLVWLFIVPLTSIGAGNAGRADEQTEFSKFMSFVVEEYDFTGSVLVRKNSETIYTAGFGLANIELNVPNTPQTKFRIGSVSKQFTAMAIMILAENKKLRLDDPINKYFAQPVDAWKAITIHHLLNHTSGLMHSWELDEFRENLPKPMTLVEVLDLFKPQPLLTEPGSSFHYSGVGYFILAHIIQSVTDSTYESYLRSEIFMPLGMDDTGSDDYFRILAKRADGYTRTSDGLQNASPIYMPNLLGGGSLYSTVLDLAKWDQALQEGKLLSAEGYKSMFTPGLENYGYGWRIYYKQNYGVIEHTGSVNGFHAYIRRIPDRKLAIIVLTNESTSESWELVTDGLEKIGANIE